MQFEFGGHELFHSSSIASFSSVCQTICTDETLVLLSQRAIPPRSQDAGLPSLVPVIKLRNTINRGEAPSCTDASTRLIVFLNLHQSSYSDKMSSDSARRSHARHD